MQRKQFTLCRHGSRCITVLASEGAAHATEAGVRSTDWNACSAILAWSSRTERRSYKAHSCYVLGQEPSCTRRKESIRYLNSTWCDGRVCNSWSYCCRGCGYDNACFDIRRATRSSPRIWTHAYERVAVRVTSSTIRTCRGCATDRCASRKRIDSYSCEDEIEL